MSCAANRFGVRSVAEFVQHDYIVDPMSIPRTMIGKALIGSGHDANTLRRIGYGIHFVPAVVALTFRSVLTTDGPSHFGVPSALRQLNPEY